MGNCCYLFHDTDIFSATRPMIVSDLPVVITSEIPGEDHRQIRRSSFPERNPARKNSYDHNRIKETMVELYFL